MKEHIQTVINVCFAVFITAFIYQNGKQQDRIDALENTDSVDSQWQLSEEKFKKLIFDLSVLKGTVANNQKREEAEKNITYQSMLAIDENIDNLIEGVNRNRDNLIKAENNQNYFIDVINNLPDPKSTYEIQSIIENCTTNKRSFETHNHRIEC